MIIRKMEERDADKVFAMMRVFYDSPAVIHKAKDEILYRDIYECIGDSQYATGYVFDEDGEYAGYAMVSPVFSTEYGGICIWVEDLYVKQEFRGRKISKAFFEQLERDYAGKAVRMRLEVENENERAMAVYAAAGLTQNEYVVMEKLLKCD